MGMQHMLRFTARIASWVVGHSAPTLCKPCQPPEALPASSARPEPVDSVAMTMTGMRAACDSSPAAEAHASCYDMREQSP